MAVIFPCSRRTRVLIAAGARPPLSIMEPALVASSPSLAMASINALGGGPELSLDLTSIMKRIVGSPVFGCEPGAGRTATGDIQALSIERTGGGKIDSHDSFFNTFS